MKKGGIRKGAGRKALPKGEKKISLSVRIKPDIYNQLPGKGRGVLIETALRNYFKNENA